MKEPGAFATFMCITTSWKQPLGKQCLSSSVQSLQHMSYAFLIDCTVVSRTLFFSFLEKNLAVVAKPCEKHTFQWWRDLWECSSGMCHIFTSLLLGPHSPLLPALFDSHKRLLEVVSRTNASILGLVACLYIAGITVKPWFSSAQLFDNDVNVHC